MLEQKMLEQKMLDLLIANLIWGVHTLLLISFLTGPFQPKRLLRYTIWFYPLTLLAWRVNQGRCILTDIENYYRGVGPREQFIQPMLLKIGVEISEKTNDRMMLLLLIPWLWSYVSLRV